MTIKKNSKRFQGKIIIYVQNDPKNPHRMVSGDKARCVFMSLLKDWEPCVVDSLGQLDGILSAWNPKIIYVKPFISFVGI